MLKYGNFIDNLRLFTRGGSGGMGYPRLGGEAHKKMTLKQLKDKYPRKRFVAGEGANSRVNALKGSRGKDCEIPVPVGISVTDENGKIIGELNKEKDRILFIQIESLWQPCIKLVCHFSSNICSLCVSVTFC
uniref:Obg domain-containing protein n=1 Tax=Panthera leo TaxID=9689 RepID=A0A8C8Y5A9_PANLE